MATDSQAFRDAFIEFLLKGQHAVLYGVDDEPGSNPGERIRRYRENDNLLLSRHTLVPTESKPYRTTSMQMAFCSNDEKPDPGSALWHIMTKGRTVEETKIWSGLDHAQRGQLIQDMETFLVRALLANENPGCFRGPDSFEDGTWLYLCDQYSDDSLSFYGSESILYHDDPVYLCTFVGQLKLRGP